MREFNSIEEFLEEANLSEKKGASRKGEFIGIYGSRTHKKQGFVSAEVVDNYSLKKYNGLYFKRKNPRSKVEVGTSFLAMFSVSSEIGKTLRVDSGNLKFNGGGLLNGLKITPPAIWRVDKLHSRSGEQTTLEIHLEDFVC